MHENCWQTGNNIPSSPFVLQPSSGYRLAVKLEYPNGIRHEREESQDWAFNWNPAVRKTTPLSLTFSFLCMSPVVPSRGSKEDPVPLLSVYPFAPRTGVWLLKRKGMEASDLWHRQSPPAWVMCFRNGEKIKYTVTTIFKLWGNSHVQTVPYLPAPSLNSKSNH